MNMTRICSFSDLNPLLHESLKGYIHNDEKILYCVEHTSRFGEQILYHAYVLTQNRFLFANKGVNTYLGGTVYKEEFLYVEKVEEGTYPRDEEQYWVKIYFSRPVQYGYDSINHLQLYFETLEIARGFASVLRKLAKV